MVWRWVVWACGSGMSGLERKGSGREGEGRQGGLCVSFFVRSEGD